jgi:HSP20 family protein
MAKLPSVIDPFHEMFSLREDMERVFDSMIGRLSRDRTDAAWIPAVDVEETEDSIVARVEIPGMRKEDIKVKVVGNTLTISGERKSEVEQKTRTFHHVERSYGRFSRTLSLPAEVDSDAAHANYKAGVLELILPKTTKAKPREIAVKGED